MDFHLQDQDHGVHGTLEVDERQDGNRAIEESASVLEVPSQDRLPVVPTEEINELDHRFVHEHNEYKT